MDGYITWRPSWTFLLPWDTAKHVSEKMFISDHCHQTKSEYSGEGNVVLYATPNHFNLNEICLNQTQNITVKLQIAKIIRRPSWTFCCHGIRPKVSQGNVHPWSLPPDSEYQMLPHAGQIFNYPDWALAVCFPSWSRTARWIRTAESNLGEK